MKPSVGKGKERCKIVAVDGPAGSGKSSVCAMACQQLGWTYVNTGFLYRSIALICRRQNGSFQDSELLRSIVRDFTENLSWDPKAGKVFYLGEDLSDALYTDQAGKDASLIAKNPAVREELLPLQRKLSLQSPIGAIVDGRDIGTVVFPDADFKVFMTASIEERAKRRLIQLQGGPDKETDRSKLEEIKSSIEARDKQDAARGTSPLKQADDAYFFDTSDISVERAVAKLVELIKSNVTS
ncbi:(d)CMP kinase [Pseudobacteriovorax antillogorgiicola]|nr:(d)CMP kinase [Pseudobacteriovorax antillogorgiicola]